MASGNGPGDEVINTDFLLVITTSEPHTWWNRLKGAGNKAWDWATTDGLQSLSDFSAGFGDTISFGLTRKFRQWQGYDDVVDTDSGAYTVGEYSGYAWDIAAGGAVAKGGVKLGARAAGSAGKIGAKLEIHTAHHTFGRLGNLSHIQLNTWVKGVKNSGRAYRIPLPSRTWPRRDIRIFLKK